MRGRHLKKTEEMLLALLHASLQGQVPETNAFDNAGPDDWKACCDLAIKQGVMALAWDGIAMLPKQQMPPRDLKIAWALAVERYEKKYAYYCQVVAQLSAFYQEHGIRMVQLKGVGLSTYYPNPVHREGGDIDIFTCSADLEKLTDKEAHDLADKLMMEQGIEIDYTHSKKHSEFYYQGIPIENHITLLDVEICPLVRQAEGILRKCMRPHLVTLPTGNDIYVPSVEFNTLFVAFHTAQHYGHGLALHHLYDWACIIKQHGVNLPEGITDRHFLQGIDAMNYLCNRYLGTSVEVSGKEKMAAEMLAEIFDPFMERKLPESGFWKQMNFKARRFVHVTRVHNTFFYTPLWRKRELWRKIGFSIVWHTKMLWERLYK